MRCTSQCKRHAYLACDWGWIEHVDGENMSRRSRQRLGISRGTRLPVASAFQPHLPQHPKLWALGLTCGHTTRFVSNEKPKHVACPHGCVDPEVAAGFIAERLGTDLP